jgi:hypothetical protein
VLQYAQGIHSSLPLGFSTATLALSVNPILLQPVQHRTAYDAKPTDAQGTCVSRNDRTSTKIVKRRQEQLLTGCNDAVRWKRASSAEQAQTCFSRSPAFGETTSDGHPGPRMFIARRAVGPLRCVRPAEGAGSWHVTTAWRH